MKWSPQQEAALNDVKAWLKNPKELIYRLFGFAGTGKTTLARHLVEGISGLVLNGAYTGKAALVMRQNGVENATTFHKMVYRLVPMDEIKMRELKKEKKTASPEEADRIMMEMRELSQPKFEVNPESGVRRAKLIVLDECSMLNDAHRRDILSFNVPILVLGDPGQLPPISGEGAFTRDPPQTLLTEIHRQALDNPIIQLSMLAREGRKIPFETFGESMKIRLSQFRLKHAKEANQIICGKNETRRMQNKKWRYHHDFIDTYPMEGEKVICLKNSVIELHDEETDKTRTTAIFNGQLFSVVDSEESSPYTNLLVKDEEGTETPVEAFNAYFDEYRFPETLKEYTQYDMKGFHQFDFGYAITCHKSQGSQWPNILLLDDHIFGRDPEMRKQWLYTAITRAENSICIVDG